MTETHRFPWKVGLCGSVLLLLALLTVSIRASVVAEGHVLMRLEHRRAALQRRERDLQLDLQRQWNELGRQDTSAARSGGSRS